MEKNSKAIQRAVWSMLALVIAGIGGAFVWSKVSGGQPLMIYGEVTDFKLVNQEGEEVTLDTLKGQVWIADIVFTRCAGPCPLMTRRMSELQSMLPANSPIRLITLTTDPDYDTPAVLKQYGEKFGARPERWWFLTGAKEQIAKLAVQGLKLVSIEKDEAERTDPNDLFIHSTLFVLVDKQGRMRGTFEYDDPEMKQKLLSSVKKLLREK